MSKLPPKPMTPAIINRGRGPEIAGTRITVYVNYYSGVMHVWQDGVSQQHVTFHRDLHTICQWHWGLYASGNNDDIVLFEDDQSLWKLNQAWTNWDKEPYFDHGVAVCAANYTVSKMSLPKLPSASQMMQRTGSATSSASGQTSWVEISTPSVDL